MNKEIGLAFSLFIFLALATSVLAEPRYSSVTNEPTNNTEYQPDKTYSFQVTWKHWNGTDENNHGIDNATFECDFNTTTVNYTSEVVNNTAGVYWINFTMGVNITSANQTMSYRWFAINETSSENATASQAYSIAKNTSVPVCINMTVYASGSTESNVSNANAVSTEGQGDPYADCTMETSGTECTGTNNPLWGTDALYRDDASWTQGSSGATALGVADYTIKCNSTGNVNYTNNATGASYTLTVIAAGGGGGGGGGIVTTTTQPTWTLPTWQPPEEGWTIEPKWIIIGIIVLLILAGSKKKK